MTAALLLIAYVLAVSTVGPRVLSRPWASQSPRAAVVGWQAVSSSVVLAILLAAVALALPFLPVRFSLASLLGAHPVTVVEHYESPLGAWPGVGGLVLVTAWSVMLVVGTLRAFRRTAGVRRAQREALLLVGSPHPDGFTIVDHPVPVAYCLPGRDSTVVLSSSALALLSDQERALVLGHERRHLSARHHLALAYADALARTFRWVPLFARAREEVAVLLEMTADDAASSPSDRRALARALVTLAAGARVEATLAASDTAALQRVRRLVAPAVPRRRGVGVATASVAFVALSAPVALALAPAIEAITSECCTPAALPVRV